MANGLSPKFPLSISFKGDFANNENIKDLVKQNFRTLLLTIPGERIMIPDFGVGFERYLFELKNSGIPNNLTSDIHNQVNKYLPYIEIENIDLNRENEIDDILSVRIQYFIKPLSQRDIIDLLAI
jgi:phage baseplate assembly protein W